MLHHHCLLLSAVNLWFVVLETNRTNKRGFIWLRHHQPVFGLRKDSLKHYY